jgi:hypothetical protein
LGTHKTPLASRKSLNLCRLVRDFIIMFLSKKLLLMLALAAGQSTLHGADSIGWKYDGIGDDTLDPSEVAGVAPYAQAYWNNHGPVQPDPSEGVDQGVGEVPFELLDSAGLPSGVSVTAWTLSAVNSWAMQYESPTSDEKLMDSFSNREPSITFSGIPADYISNGYSVIVYYGNNEGPSTSLLSITGSEDDLVSRNIQTGDKDGAGFQAVGYLQETGALEAPTNYTVFTGLDDPSFTVSLTGANNNGIHAIQIVKENGAPTEPTNPDPEDAPYYYFRSVGTTLSWKESKRATEYRVYLWKEDEDEPDEATAVVGTNSYTPASPLEPDAVYLWKVIASNGGGDTPSGTWSFTTGDGGLPTAPESPFPDDGETLVPLSYEFAWDPSYNADRYEVYLWETSGTQPTEPTWSGTVYYFQPNSSFRPNTSYSWQVVALNDDDQTPGPVWSFTTAPPSSIGWNYDGPYADDALDPNQIAGVAPYAQKNWNNHAGSGQGAGSVPFALINSDGEDSGASVTAWTVNANSWHMGYGTADPNEMLMNSFNDKNASITFSNIPAEYLASGYSVVVYYSQNEGPATSVLTVTGNLDDVRSRTITTGNAAAGYGAIGFFEGTDDNASVPTNYTVFTGLDDSAFTVALTNNNNNGICAIQIVQEYGPPAAVYNPTPADNAEELALSTSLSWQPALRAASYEVYLWKDGESQPTSPTAVLTSTSYDPEGNLDPSTLYLWQVVAINELGTNPGPVWSFTTGLDVAPAQVVGPTPADNATGVLPSTSFSWSPAARAAGYELYLWKTSESAPETPTAVLSTPGYTPTATLDGETSYSWRVDSTNGAGSTTGTVWQFTTGELPEAPTGPVPADLASDVVRQLPKLDWSDSPSATSYRVYLWPSSEAAPTTPFATTSSSELALPVLLDADTTYSWRVDPVNEYGIGEGTTWTFTTSSAVSNQRSIGWNYDAGATWIPNYDRLEPSEVAGIPGFAQAYWNNHTGTTGGGQGVAEESTLPFELLDNEGNPSGAAVTAWTVTVANSYWTEYTGTDPNGKLMNAFNDKDPSLTFSGIPADYLEEGYTVIVYLGDNEVGSSNSLLTISGSIDDVRSREIRMGGPTSTWAAAGYVEATDDSDVTATGPRTNYSVFTDLNDPEFTVALTAIGAANNHGITAIQIIKGVIEQPSGSPFEDWAAAAGLVDGDAAFDADPDGDGIDNGLEFLLGGQPNPNLPGSNSLELLPVVEASGENLVFTFTRVRAADSIEAIVEFSTTLDGDWTEATDLNATIQTTPGEDSDTVTVTIPKGSADKLFARLRAVDPSPAP